jgi:hypothetical protein
LLLSATVLIAEPAKAQLSPAGEGRRDFVKFNCYGCHGPFARGQIAVSLVGHASLVPRVIANGTPQGMPSFRSLLTATDVSNIQAYISSLNTSSEPVFFDWWKPNPNQ